MLQYEVVCVEAKTLYETEQKLKEKVKNLIKMGYKPQGGAGIASFSLGDHTLSTSVYYQLTQAMIKED